MPVLPPLPALPPAALQRLQPQHVRKPAFLSEPPPAQHETPRRLISSKSLTDIGSAMKGVILTETNTALPTPMRRESGVRGASLDLDNGAAEASGSSSSEGQTISERHRLPRRRSILQPSSSRPTMPQSATTSLIPRVPSGSSGQSQSVAESSSSGGSSLITERAAPVWDHDDEENLPSPFAKRNIDFSVYSRADRGSGAAVNGTVPGGAARATIAASVASKPRTSMISKALKASGEAQKALARRQAEGKSSIS